MRGKTARRLRKATRFLEGTSERTQAWKDHKIFNPQTRLYETKRTVYNHPDSHHAKYKILKRIWKSLSNSGKRDFWNPNKA